MRAWMRRFGFRQHADGGGELALYAEALLARFYSSQEC